MPDISMCANEQCPSRSECYRFTATPNPWWQSYGDFKANGDRCDYFTSNGKQASDNGGRAG